jgi:hypothetical protein
MARRALVALIALSASACAVGPKHVAQGHWDYVIEPPARGATVLQVEATFERAGTERLSVADEGRMLVRDLEIATDHGYRPAFKSGAGWMDPTCVMHCSVRYSVDLDALARACENSIDCGARVGDTFITPSLVWLVHPSPRMDVPLTLRVRGGDTRVFATGMAEAEGQPLTYSFRSVDVDEGAFTAFGPMRRRELDAPGKKRAIDLQIIGDHGMKDDEIATWVSEASKLTSSVTGEFPLSHVSVFVVPAPGEDSVVFGKVLSLSGASVGLVVGSDATFAKRHDDWVVVHELFHLGFPSFRGEGRWLGEGLATYYEPLLRSRASWISEEDVWGQFYREMPRGQPRRGSSAGLIARDDLQSVYWGGATFALAADVRIRAETNGEHTLDDVIRATLSRGGDATRVFTVTQVMKLGDEATGTRVLSDLYDRHAARGEPFDLDELFASLGVEVTRDGVIFHDDARLAPIRRALSGRRPM